MAASIHQKTRTLTVLAQDPSFGTGNNAITTVLTLPDEALERGPKGHRVHVIDYDASTDTLYKPLPRDAYGRGDPYAEIRDRDRLLSDPRFHAQNVYAIAMATLGRFEAALGRHVAWGFDSMAHQLKIAPHAFAEANAFYSRRDESLMFGYFPGRKESVVYTCLSHDVVAHETTHAILDGLRPRFIRPSSSDQAAFHEGFGDFVALLSVLRNQPVVEEALRAGRRRARTLRPSDLERTKLEDSVLFRLGEQMGQELEGLGRDSLRRSVELRRRRDRKRLLALAEFELPHRRGEVLVAAAMNAFLNVWLRRLEGIGLSRGGVSLDLERVAEEGATAAEHLMKIAIRALDATPPVDLEFPDYLSALLTADYELHTDDTKWEYRQALRESFAEFGIEPATRRRSPEPGIWDPPSASVSFEGVSFAEMQWDREEVARFVWQNRSSLEIDERAFTRVQSVRPVVRAGCDGFLLRETVVEYFSLISVRAAELASLDIRKPPAMPDSEYVRLQGGGTLIFDDFGRLKFHIGTGVTSAKQSQRLAALFEAEGVPKERHFEQLHRMRQLPREPLSREGW